MKISRFICVACLLGATALPALAVRTDILDPSVVKELPDEHRNTIDEADRLYRVATQQSDPIKRKRAYESAIVQYELFVTRYQDSTDENALCYAFLKLGICHDAINSRTTAQGKYNIVIENYDHEGLYYIPCIYYLAVSYTSDPRMEAKGVELLGEFLKEFEAIKDRDHSIPAVRRVMHYHKRMRKNAQYEEAGLVLARLAKDHWNNGIVRETWDELWAHGRAGERWSLLEELGKARGWDAGKINWEIFQARLQQMAAAWDALQNDKTRQDKLLPKAQATVAALADAMNKASSPEHKRNLAIMLLEWQFARRPNAPFVQGAFLNAKAWMEANKADGGYMQKIMDVAQNFGGFTFDNVNELYRAYVAANPKDLSTVNRFIVLMERWSKNDVAESELQRITASNKAWGDHFARIGQWAKAAERYVAVYGETDATTAGALDNAAWVAAQAFENARNLSTAIEWYKRATGKGYDTTNALARCHRAMGGADNFKIAIDYWQEIYQNTNDKNWQGRAASEICTTAFDFMKNPTVGQTWARRCARDTVGTHWPGVMNQLADKHGFDIRGGSTE